MPPSTTLKGEQNSWIEYRRLVLAELDRVSQEASKAIQQGNAIQLALAQALSDTKSSLLDKLRETAAKLEDNHDKRLESSEKEMEKKIAVVDAKIPPIIAEAKWLRDNIDIFGKDLSALKAKAAMLGALAGLLVTIVGIGINMYMKR